MRLIFAACVLASVLARSAQAHPGSGIVVDRRGRVFFVVLGSNAIMMLERGRARPFVDDDRLHLPHHLVLGREGELYAASDHDGRVWRIGPDGSLTEYFRTSRAGSDSLYIGSGGDPFTIDGVGNIYALASPRAGALVRISLDGRVTPMAQRARLGQMHFSTMAWGADGALYVTDATRVWRIVGDSATPIVPRGESLRLAAGIAVDAAGNIYVADYAGARVLRFTRDGHVNTPPSVERLALKGPTGVTIAPNGDVYVLDVPRRSVAIWRATQDRGERLYIQRDLPSYFFAALITLFPLLLALQSWARTPRNLFDWLVWTLVTGVAIIGLYWIFRDVVLFSPLRLLIIAVFILGAWKSYRRLGARKAVPATA